MSSDEAFAGYWNRPDADEKAIRDGWYHTGDVGRLDEDGDLWLDGRLDDMIVSGGENVHPLEVEDVLARHPGVREVAVVGAPDDRLGHRVVAVVVGEATADELDAHCLASDTLARFKRPREYRFVPELPKSPSGKILRRRMLADDASTHGFRVDRDDRGVVTITLDDPEKMNRVPLQARGQLAHLFAEMAEDDAARFVVITGAGENFTAGGDIAAFMTATPEHLSRLAWNIAAAERFPKPVIARIRGYCLGVGLELALACDFRVAADDAQLGLPEVGLGMIPGSGGTQRLARLVGLGRAKDVVMRRKRISAADALAWGLVSEVVPADELDAAVERVIADLDGLSPLALRMAKRVLNHVYDAPLSIGLELEGLAYGLLRTTDDFAEGVEAFGEKRPPTSRAPSCRFRPRPFVIGTKHPRKEQTCSTCA